MHRHLLVLLIVLASLAGCQNVTIVPDPAVRVSENPSYQDSRNFFFWGLMGEQHVNVSDVCGDRTVAQMQSQQTFINGLLSGLTLGIYTPHSVRVWCDETVLNRSST